MLLQICLLITQVLSISHIVYCAALDNTLFLPTGDNANIAPQPQIQTFTKSDRESPVLLHTTITSYSTGNHTILRPKVNTEKTRIHDIPAKGDSTINSDTNTSQVVTTSTNIKRANSDVTNQSNHIIFGVVNATHVNNKEKNNYFENGTGSGVNKDNNDTAHLNRWHNSKVAAILKITPGIRVARWADWAEDPRNESILQPDGYIYNVSLCRYVDDRVLCGYEKNPEEPKKKAIIELDDVCRKYGDRIECAYWEPPFPDVYNLDPQRDKIANLDFGKYPPEILIARTGRLKNKKRKNKGRWLLRSEIFNITRPETDAKENPKSYKTLPNTLKSKSNILRANLTSTNFNATDTDTISTQRTKPKVKCIEKGGRIFCPTV